MRGKCLQGNERTGMDEIMEYPKNYRSILQLFRYNPAAVNPNLSRTQVQV